MLPVLPIAAEISEEAREPMMFRLRSTFCGHAGSVRRSSK